VKSLFILSFFLCALSAKAGLEERLSFRYLDSQKQRKQLARIYKKPFTEHFEKIKNHEQENQVVCIAIKLNYNAALGVKNVFQVKSLCRRLEQDSKAYALFTTFRQIENNYWNRFPDFDAYQYEQGTETLDFSN
jgi:hypothetical protein